MNLTGTRNVARGFDIGVYVISWGGGSHEKNPLAFAQFYAALTGPAIGKALSLIPPEEERRYWDLETLEVTALSIPTAAELAVPGHIQRQLSVGCCLPVGWLRVGTVSSRCWRNGSV